MMFWYGGHWGSWQGALSLVVMVAFWGLFAWALYAVLTGVRRWPGQYGGRPDSHSILDERLARGEIDQDQYKATLDLIRTGGAGPAPAGGGR